MAKIKTGRAIVHFFYRSETTGKTYNSIILGLERVNGKYSLPGGQFDPRKDTDTLDTALRELEEEFGLSASRSSAQKVCTFNGHVCCHDIYVVDATGTLILDPNELKGIGFYNAGRHNQIPTSLLERHVQALNDRYYGTRHQKKNASDIAIPGYYFEDNNIPDLIDWVTQRDSF
ncbi:hypothetical protein GF327_05230 [Candidatus Woesearchaeota archaeon]|nr:hypothetical protein [Candidatus Woesearchaeota archaeon]